MVVMGLFMYKEEDAGGKKMEREANGGVYNLCVPQVMKSFRPINGIGFGFPSSILIFFSPPIFQNNCI